MNEHRGMSKHGGRHPKPSQPSCFLGMCWPKIQPQTLHFDPWCNFMTPAQLPAPGAHMGKAGQSWRLCLWFVISLPGFALFLFHVLQLSSFLMPFFIIIIHAFFLTDKGHHPGQKRTQSALCDPVSPLPALQDMQNMQVCNPLPFLCHPPAGGEGESHTWHKREGNSAVCGAFFSSTKMW